MCQCPGNPQTFALCHVYCVSPVYVAHGKHTISLACSPWTVIATFFPQGPDPCRAVQSLASQASVPREPQSPLFSVQSVDPLAKLTDALDTRIQKDIFPTRPTPPWEVHGAPSATVAWAEYLVRNLLSNWFRVVEGCAEPHAPRSLLHNLPVVIAASAHDRGVQTSHVNKKKPSNSG